MVNTVSAQKDTNYGLDTVAEGKLKISSTPSEMIGKVIGSVLGFVSVIFFLLTIYGGILWMTARGNEQQTDKALHTITSASIGLAIVLGSYVLVGFLFMDGKGIKNSGVNAAGIKMLLQKITPLVANGVLVENMLVAFFYKWNFYTINSSKLLTQVSRIFYSFDIYFIYFF